MADYSLLGSFSTGGASALNGDLLTKLRDADQASALFQIDKQLEDITGLDADTGVALDTLGESDKMAVIKAQAVDLMSKISTFDLASTDTTVFDAVSASTNGTAAVFDAVDVSGLEPGTNNITVTQLAQRDVSQSITLTKAEKDGGISIISADATDFYGSTDGATTVAVDMDGDGDTGDADDTLILALSAKISITMYDADGATKVESNAIADINAKPAAGSIKVNGVEFTLDGSESYEDLRAKIDANVNFTASFDADGKMLISHKDADTAITITDDNFALGFTNAKLTSYDFFAASDTTVTDIADVTYKGYIELVDEINANDKFIASIETVGTDSYRVVIKSTDSGENNTLKISQTNMDLGLGDSTTSNAITSTAQEVQTVSITGGVTGTTAAESFDFLGKTFTVDNTDQGGGTYNFDTAAEVTDHIINNLGTLIADWNTANPTKEIDTITQPGGAGTTSLQITYKDTEGDVDTIAAITGNNGVTSDASVEKTTGFAQAGSLTLNGKDIFTADNVEDLQALINAHSDYTASFDSNNKLVIKSSDTFSSIEVTEDTIGLGFDYTSRTQKAQNLEANVDGIDYNVDSNTLTIQGNLTMTAVELGDASINITKDTTAILTGIEGFIESYNALIDLVEEEVSDTNSPMYDISSLKSMTSSIKDMLFTSYGLGEDQNLFNYGLDLDLKGHLSIDSSIFAKALVDNYSDVKYLFLGNTTDTDLASSDSTKYMGMGTQIKTYLDGLDDYEGLLTRYETNMTERQKQLEQDREDAIKALDTKYSALGEQYSMYGSAISQMESAFSGMSMMIQQSVTSK